MDNLKLNTHFFAFQSILKKLFKKVFTTGLVLFFTSVTLVSLSNLYGQQKGRIKNNIGLSKLYLPVLYSQEELEKSLNQYYLKQNGLFCEDTSYTNFNNDHLKTLCQQKDRIKITIKDGEVTTKVPIQIIAKYLIEKKFHLNLLFYEKVFHFELERNINFDILVVFKTRVILNKKLELIPSTTWSFEWLTYPSVRFGFFSFRVTDVAVGAIARTLEEYANERINNTLVEEINLPIVLKAIQETTEQPFLIDASRGIWAYSDLQEIKTGQIELDNGNIQFYFEGDFYGYLSFNFSDLVAIRNHKQTTIKPAFNQSLLKKGFLAPPIQIKDKKDAFNVDLLMKISPVKLEKLILDYLISEGVKIGSGERSLEVNEIYIKKINRFIEADVYLKNNDPKNKIRNLILNLKFIPYYDSTTKKIRVKNLSYQADTGSKLINFGGVLFKKNIEKTLEENLGISVENFITNLQENLNQDLTSVQVDNQKQIEMFFNTLEITKIDTDQSNLRIYFSAGGQAKLKLKNLF